MLHARVVLILVVNNRKEVVIVMNIVLVLEIVAPITLKPAVFKSFYCLVINNLYFVHQRSKTRKQTNARGLFSIIYQALCKHIHSVGHTTAKTSIILLRILVSHVIIILMRVKCLNIPSCSLNLHTISTIRT